MNAKWRFFSGVLLLTFLFFSGCKDNVPTYVGEWVASEVILSNCVDRGSNPVGCTENSCYRLVLAKDGACNFQRDVITFVGNWSVEGDELQLCNYEDGLPDCEEFTISVQNDGMVLSGVDISSGCDVIYVMSRR